jgi:hypothetical protein
MSTELALLKQNALEKWYASRMELPPWRQYTTSQDNFSVRPHQIYLPGYNNQHEPPLAAGVAQHLLTLRESIQGPPYLASGVTVQELEADLSDIEAFLTSDSATTLPIVEEPAEEINK